ncbi:unnamed protein product [Miscanthus lutarioriparius]|uniref:EF-hand domain-containing protein n=1 Tax=Miscanthus lutarioriparius TaxID=422564 RepID=A0A811QL52_9POAL|nr:unnamed protein product [Miscanthus lutarioriparius]
MAGSAVAVVFLSAVALLCLYNHLLLSLSDPASVVPVPAAVVRAHRRSGGHRANTTPSGSGNIVLRFGMSGQPLRVHAHAPAPAPGSGLPDIDTFRDKLDRLLPDWSRFDAELGPMHRYFGLDGPLDVRQRLAYLFAILDRSPRDGGVGVGELEAWLRRQAAARLDAVTRREMARHDMDGNGAVTLREFFAVIIFVRLVWVENSEMDHDGDGKLSLEEFVGQSHMIIAHISGAHHDDGGHDLERAEAEKKFRELDADMDNYLTVEEARSALQSLITGEFSYATSHAKFLMKADVNQDGKLSLEEMLDDYVSFYSTVYTDDHYSNEVDSDSHDEL